MFLQRLSHVDVLGRVWLQTWLVLPARVHALLDLHSRLTCMVFPVHSLPDLRKQPRRPSAGLLLCLAAPRAAGPRCDIAPWWPVSIQPSWAGTARLRALVPRLWSPSQRRPQSQADSMSRGRASCGTELHLLQNSHTFCLLLEIHTQGSHEGRQANTLTLKQRGHLA